LSSEYFWDSQTKKKPPGILYALYPSLTDGLQEDVGKLKKDVFAAHFTKALSLYVGKKGKVPSYFFEQLFTNLPKVRMRWVRSLIF
jgi:hypothetical protein